MTKRKSQGGIEASQYFADYESLVLDIAHAKKVLQEHIDAAHRAGKTVWDADGNLIDADLAAARKQLNGAIAIRDAIKSSQMILGEAGAKHRKAQSAKASARRPVVADGRPMDEIITALAKSNPGVRAKDLWPVFFAELKAEGFEPRLVLKDSPDPAVYFVTQTEATGAKKFTTFRRLVAKARKQLTGK